MPNIHGLHTSSPDSDSDDDDKETRYVGGTDNRGGGSGLAVLPSGGGDGGPKDAFGRLVDNAKTDAETSGTPNPSAADCARKVTMWSSGFQVDDGEFRPLSDPANKPFLEALAGGVVPPELQPPPGTATEGPVHIHLVDRRKDTYVPPDYTPFSGGGNSMASASSDPGTAEGIVVSAAGEGTFVVPVFEEGEPGGSVQVRLRDV